ncbi:MAG: hypothetical protein NTW79_03360 [Candidatus Berkelbacteria bacterium]|nr:hypothetical protein [Candidatus Berkelbacteria bacterium]
MAATEITSEMLDHAIEQLCQRVNDFRFMPARTFFLKAGDFDVAITGGIHACTLLIAPAHNNGSLSFSLDRDFRGQHYPENLFTPETLRKFFELRASLRQKFESEIALADEASKNKKALPIMTGGQIFSGLLDEFSINSIEAAE